MLSDSLDAAAVSSGAELAAVLQVEAVREQMIDVEELICELHHIAGTESVDADIRRTACDAESALASLRAWVNELQMNVAEREAIKSSIWDYEQNDDDEDCARMVSTLRGLLKRHGATSTR